MKKNYWNRWISLAAAAAMCITLLVSPGLSAAAAQDLPQAETMIELTVNEDLLLVGAVYNSAAYSDPACVTAPEPYTVTKVEFTDAGGTEQLQEGEVIPGHSNIEITLTSDAGFAEALAITINHIDANILKQGVTDGVAWIICEAAVESLILGYIDEVSLEVTPPQPGAAVSAYSYTAENYTAAGDWYQWDAEQNAYIPAADAPDSADPNYKLEFRVTPRVGYVLEEGGLYINGTYLSTDLFSLSATRMSGFYCFDPASDTPIDHVVIDEAVLPVPEVGKSYSETQRFSIPTSSDQYQIEAYWMDEEGGTTGTFKKAPYQLMYEVYAQKGYSFAEEVTVETDSGTHWYMAGGKCLAGSFDFSLETPIEKVELPKVPTAEIGKTLPGGEDFDLEVPAGAKYTATAHWAVYEPDEVLWCTLEEDATVKAGEKYRLVIDLYAQPEYRFADEIDMVINGIPYKETVDVSAFQYAMTYSFLKQIPRVEVIGVTQPTIGAVPSYDSLKAAEPDQYEIVGCIWLDLSGVPETVTRFEAGHAYYLEVQVRAKDGYEFAPYFSCKMGDDEWFVYATDETTLRILQSEPYSFESVIPDIRVSNVPTMVVGQTAINGPLTVPSDVKYIASTQWWVWNAQTECYEQFSGVFEKGKTYQLELRALFREPGYRFDEDTTVWYLDGVQQADGFISRGFATYEIEYPQEGLTLIQQVELSIDPPKTGYSSSVPPTVTLLNTTGCHVPSEEGFWTIGDNSDFRRENFEAGREYGVWFNLVADEGYGFAEDLIVVVNGVVLPADAIDNLYCKTVKINYHFNMTCAHVYDDAADTTCNVCGAEDAGRNQAPAPNPDTGDSALLLLAFVVMLASAAAVMGLVASGKKGQKTSC